MEMRKTIERVISDNCTSDDIEKVIAYANKEISEWNEFVEYCRQILVEMQRNTLGETNGTE